MCRNSLRSLVQSVWTSSPIGIVQKELGFTLDSDRRARDHCGISNRRTGTVLTGRLSTQHLVGVGVQGI